MSAYPLPDDVIRKIDADFGSQGSEAVELLYKAISTSKYLNDARIVRCVIFLAEKNLKKLVQAIEMARVDPRDVMFLAEYTNHAEEDPMRIRDLSKPFNEQRVASSGA